MKRINLLANMVIAGALGASNGAGYGIGYAKESVKKEACYYGNKVKDTISNTEIVKSFTEGYYNGETDARAAFDCRVSAREQKAEQRATQKALDRAVEELMDEINEFEFDDVLCGDGEWCNE